MEETSIYRCLVQVLLPDIEEKQLAKIFDGLQHFKLPKNILNEDHRVNNETPGKPPQRSTSMPNLSLQPSTTTTASSPTHLTNPSNPSPPLFPPSPLLNLPPELIYLIFTHLSALSPYSPLSLALTCKPLARLAVRLPTPNPFHLDPATHPLTDAHISFLHSLQSGWNRDSTLRICFLSRKFSAHIMAPSPPLPSPPPSLTEKKETTTTTDGGYSYSASSVPEVQLPVCLGCVRLLRRAKKLSGRVAAAEGQRDGDGDGDGDGGSRIGWEDLKGLLKVYGAGKAEMRRLEAELRRGEARCKGLDEELEKLRKKDEEGRWPYAGVFYLVVFVLDVGFMVFWWRLWWKGQLPAWLP
ncbi:MAG: hypothetical protein Q9227_006481 [Pyrenula ochraceoflavens]